MLKNKLHSETHTDELLYRSPPLLDLPDKNRVDEVVLDVIQHTSQHLQEMLPRRMTKAELSHKIAMTTVEHHQVRGTVLRDSKAIKVHIGRTESPEMCRAKVINFQLVKTDKERCSIIRDGGRTTTCLKLRRDSRKQTYNKGGVERKAR